MQIMILTQKYMLELFKLMNNLKTMVHFMQQYQGLYYICFCKNLSQNPQNGYIRGLNVIIQ